VIQHEAIYPNRFRAGLLFEGSAGLLSAAGPYQREMGLSLSPMDPSGPFLFYFRSEGGECPDIESFLAINWIGVSTLYGNWEQFSSAFIKHVASLRRYCSPFGPINISIKECFAIPLWPREDHSLPISRLFRVNLQGPAEVTGLPILGMKWAMTYDARPEKGQLGALIEHRPADENGLERIILQVERLLPLTNESLDNLDSCLEAAHQRILATRDALLTPEALSLVEEVQRKNLEPEEED
jgi:hypothetical protein